MGAERGILRVGAERTVHKVANSVRVERGGILMGGGMEGAQILKARSRMYSSTTARQSLWMHSSVTPCFGQTMHASITACQSQNHTPEARVRTYRVLSPASQGGATSEGIMVFRTASAGQVVKPWHRQQPWQGGVWKGRLPPRLLPNPTQTHGTLQTSTDSSGSAPQANPPPSPPIPDPSPTPSARLVVVTGPEASSLSPFSNEPWHNVMLQMKRRLAWTDPGYVVDVFLDHEVRDDLGVRAAFEEALGPAQILLFMGVKDGVGDGSGSGIGGSGVSSGEGGTGRGTGAKRGEGSQAGTEESELKDVMVGWAEYAARVPTVLSLDSPSLVRASRLGGVAAPEEEGGGLLAALLRMFPLPTNEQLRNNERVLGTIRTAWQRSKADDLLFILLLLIDTYIADVPEMQSMRAQDFSSIQCMISNCRKQIIACIQDPNCRQAVSCLGECAPNDQVCSYRCIVSYESAALEQFSLCILQRHNCLNRHIDIPTRPEVGPMASFHGQPLTWEAAEDLFIGALRERPYSWRVVAGQNAAYDQFSCQFQLFYRGRGREEMWYDPIFQVETLDGRKVWRRRHYNVRRAEVPGTFHFSVLDNGVTSKEFWRIVHVAEDLSWALFFYSGAASVVGQAYNGAVLCTSDGLWPPDEEAANVTAALERCGIKEWELSRVDNSRCENPPLTLDRSRVRW